MAKRPDLTPEQKFQRDKQTKQALARTSPVFLPGIWAHNLLRSGGKERMRRPVRLLSWLVIGSAIGSIAHFHNTPAAMIVLAAGLVLASLWLNYNRAYKAGFVSPSDLLWARRPFKLGLLLLPLTVPALIPVLLVVAVLAVVGCVYTSHKGIGWAPSGGELSRARSDEPDDDFQDEVEIAQDVETSPLPYTTRVVGEQVEGCDEPLLDVLSAYKENPKASLAVLAGSEDTYRIIAGIQEFFDIRYIPGLEDTQICRANVAVLDSPQTHQELIDACKSTPRAILLIESLGILRFTALREVVINGDVQVVVSTTADHYEELQQSDEQLAISLKPIRVAG